MYLYSAETPTMIQQNQAQFCQREFKGEHAN